MLCKLPPHILSNFVSLFRFSSHWIHMSMDMCSESAAQNQYDAIHDFIKGTIAEKAPVVPISAQLKYNVDAVCEYIVKRIPVPRRNFISPPQMIVIRSFDVNKPGSEVEELRGGVAGGSILQVRSLVCAICLAADAAPAYSGSAWFW